MGLVFPSSPEVAEAHSLHTAGLAPDALGAPRGDTYPLIIRLESLTPEGGREGHTLEEVGAWGGGGGKGGKRAGRGVCKGFAWSVSKATKSAGREALSCDICMFAARIATCC